ncbi:hypothetical protein SAMN05421829_1303 [Aromatoleum tolulyticum]|uniref:Uncharacterized protein n=1 Tax=Aromatoleum tolulyticum TaxID=34027 RepID=A0A1N7CT71_9RHOO|nr:M23 family metallopeptidase [Aromatoleum tolulyticum]SIR66848.1 hypothetical protein SAMN05421829_1303 [Aromatoleum tolulyticum]
MIISPPFLPNRNSDTGDANWVHSAMQQPASHLTSTHALEGSYPLSNNLEWHNGIHLQGTATGDGKTPVRAIADGEVIYVGDPKNANLDKDDPQNFNPFGEHASWTDNGMIIVKHTTEIGANGNLPVEIIYYSVYMHLNEIGRLASSGTGTPPKLQKKDKVWRKDIIGYAGQIYGHAGQVHLEIAMNQENLRRLIGREPAWVDPTNIPVPTADGRSDAVFGALWLYLPASTPTQTVAPTSHLRATSQTTLGRAMWLKMTYETGNCSYEAFDNTGHPLGRREERNFEYDLYAEANRRHNALPQADRTRSSPSGWYELLRFGRNLGCGPNTADRDPLPANAAHWREIVGPNGRSIWADLNAEGTYKFSDADFLPIQTWTFINDDTTPNDQRCDSDKLKNLIADPDSNVPDRQDPATLARRLGNNDVATTLRRTVCKFPSEWNQADIGTRYAFVQDLPEFRTNPDAWPPQEKHLKALSFPDLPDDYTSATWHFHPTEFISTMRKCEWLSTRELGQLVPANIIRKPGSHDSQSTAHWEQPPFAASLTAIRTYAIDINRSLRKFLINTGIRKSCFFGNAIQETAWVTTLREQSGNNPTLHAGWYGRGLLQLTNPNGNLGNGNNNYYKYFRFVGRSPQIPHGNNELSWRDELGLNSHHASHSAGAYWVWDSKSGNQFVPNDIPEDILDKWNANIYADRAYEAENTRRVINTNSGNKVWYYNIEFARSASNVNLPAAISQNPPNHMNGLVDRSTVFVNALIVLTDTPAFQSEVGGSTDSPENYTRRRT